MQRFFSVLMAVVVAVLVAAPVGADEKLILLETTPLPAGKFNVAPDGSRLFFAGQNGKFLVVDATGKLVDQYGVPNSSSPRNLMPLPDGWYISITSYAGGHIGLVRPDGTEAKALISKGAGEKLPHSDMTGWTSPNGGTIDVKNKLIFVIDTTIAPVDDRKIPSPDWSRVAMFDFDGKYLDDFNRYDAAAPARAANDGKRTWYRDIEVDPERKRLYMMAAASQEVLAFTYEGELDHKVKVPFTTEVGGIAVLPDGRVAVGGAKTISIFSPELQLEQTVPLPPELTGYGVEDVAADAAGRLYASSRNAGVAFVRWGPGLDNPEVVGPRYLRVNVDFPKTTVTAGESFQLKATVAGRPVPVATDQWQVLARPSDGSDLMWRRLPATYAGDTLSVTPPKELRGLYELAVRFGTGPLDRASWRNDPFLQKTFALVAPGATRSVTVLSTSGRHAFQRGEPIAVDVVRRVPGTNPPVPVTAVPVRVELVRGGAVIKSVTINSAGAYAAELTSAVTSALPPGQYALRPVADGHEGYSFAFDIVHPQPASPVQRIMYHEFGGTVLQALNDSMDMAERKGMVQDWAATSSDLGFTRETMRDMPDPQAWRRENGPVDFANAALAPPQHYLAAQNGQWALEHFLDQATRYGLNYDAQLLGHCNAVRCSPASLQELSPILQRYAQWLERYPSFYGFNYNDEMWVGGFNGNQSDADWFKKIKESDFKGKPDGDARQFATNVMYDAFNKAVREVSPTAAITATPMWQFPATEGSYAPLNYRGMSESYSHYLSEGYSLPWQPAHGVDMLKRPGLPMMGVFDNLYNSTMGGDIYLKNVMQTLARGVQGTGAEHTSPFEDPLGAAAYRTANRLAEMYGPVFASMPPANEAALLYSRTQDLTEKRLTAGTPHWTAVFALYGAGLMAGVPMEITYEEDVAAGRLLEGKKPRVPMLILTGQKQALPEAVQARLREYQTAGGRIFADAASNLFPGVVKLDVKPAEIHALEELGYAADSAHPLMQPFYEKLAAELKSSLGKYRRYPVDTDDPWVGKSRFNGWAIQYVMLSNETSPYPWDAGGVWGLGDMYCKGRNAFLPKTVRLTLPAATGVVYDVFNQTLVQATAVGGSRSLTVDMTTFPGRLYAMAPAALGSPQLRGKNLDGRLNWIANILDTAGKPLAAQVPLRVQLVAGAQVAVESFVATNNRGQVEGSLTIPTGGPWTLQVTELLGGRSTSLSPVPGATLPAVLLQGRGAVEMTRTDQIDKLLKLAGQYGMALVTGKANLLSDELQAKLSDALKKRGIALLTEPKPAGEASNEVVLAVGSVDGRLGDLLGKAAGRGLFPVPVSADAPGVGRGFVTALYAPRTYGENAVALVGGNAEGLNSAVLTFCSYLAGTAPRAAAPERRGSAMKSPMIAGKPSGAAAVPKLRDAVGVRLADVEVAANGRRLVVTAEGYLNNVALVEDTGSSAKIVKTVRVGQSMQVGSPYISGDGTSFGAAARELDRIGQGFHLVAAAGNEAPVFAAYGDIGRQQNRFAASSGGEVVVAPGTFGFVCWKRAGGKWAEAWSHDYWKQFNKLDWPVTSEAERVPQFHAVIPRGADYALVLFCSTSANGWITPENFSEAWLGAFALADGTERWRFTVPELKTLLFPSLYTSPDGTKVLLQVQMGSWGKETYRFYSVSEGKPLGTWDSKTPLAAVALAAGTGRIAAALKGRLLEVRRPDGTLVYSLTWRRQPASLAFDSDGERLFVTDDGGAVTLLDATGQTLWRAATGTVVTLAAAQTGVYAAGWDGRLRRYSDSGKLVWSLDCTPAMTTSNPMTTVSKAANLAPGLVHIASRPATTDAKVPAGDNLLRNGKATLTVGGTGGWMSNGRVQVKAEELVNGKTDDVKTPWLDLDELFWDGQAGRQVWAEVTLKEPTDVTSLTVYENPGQPKSWPSEGLVQVWDEAAKKWQTAARSLFMNGAVNTYTLNLKSATKLRYVPWNSYYRNFYTSEIEVR